MRRLVTGILFLLLAAGRCHAGDPEAARVIVLANADDAESVKLARYYADRRGVPAANIIALRLPAAESIGWHAFVEALFLPLQDELVKRGWIDAIAMEATDALGRKRYAISGHTISYLVVCRGVPLKVTGEADMPAPTDGLAANPIFRTHDAAVDSELALLAQSGTPTVAFVPNPLFKNDRPSALELGRIVKVGRLDGPTYEDARALVDHALEAEKTGLVGRSYVDEGGPHAQGDRWLEETAKAMDELGFDGDVDPAGGTLPGWARLDAPALYFGWYARDLNGPFAQPGFRFPAGAIALHIHSFSAETVRSAGRDWVGPLVAHGVTATFGNVKEPYLELTHEPQLVLEALARGDSLGDAAAYAIPVYSWQGVMIGDPLYRPFKVSFDEQWERREQLAPARRPYVVLRRMRLLDRQGKRNEAIWAGLEAQKTQPDLAVGWAVAGLQRADGDLAGARMTLDAVAARRIFTAEEAPLAALIARQREDDGDAGAALDIWRRVLGICTLSREARTEWLRRGLATALVAHDHELAARWEDELKAALPSPPTVPEAAK